MSTPQRSRQRPPRSWIRSPRQDRRSSPSVLGLLGLAIAAALVLTGCSVPTVSASDAGATGSTVAGSSYQESAQAADPAAILDEFGYDATDVKQLVDQLDATPVSERKQGLMASVRPSELQLTGADGATASLPMPADEFYVSIAPFVEGTHECHFHSLTTCRGELSGAELDVTVTDADTGAVLAHGPRRAFDNGFVGLWLPRGITATVTIGYQGKTAETQVSTAADDAATCITTMQLD